MAKVQCPNGGGCYSSKLNGGVIKVIINLLRLAYDTKQYDSMIACVHAVVRLYVHPITGIYHIPYLYFVKPYCMIPLLHDALSYDTPII